MDTQANRTQNLSEFVRSAGFCIVTEQLMTLRCSFFIWFYMNNKWISHARDSPFIQKFVLHNADLYFGPTLIIKFDIKKNNSYIIINIMLLTIIKTRLADDCAKFLYWVLFFYYALLLWYTSLNLLDRKSLKLSWWPLPIGPGFSAQRQTVFKQCLPFPLGLRSAVLKNVPEFINGSVESRPAEMHPAISRDLSDECYSRTWLPSTSGYRGHY